LHTTETRNIAFGIKLTCVKTDKFRTGCISINIITGLNQKTAAMSALLTRVLRRGTQNHPDMESLSVALDELYGARVEPLIKKKGELHCIGLYADFPDCRFLTDSDDILDKTFALLGEVLLSPATQNGLLRQDYIESEKSNLIDDIRAAINDKRTYSVNRLLKTMCSNEAFGLSRLGEEDEVLAITPEILTKHHQTILSDSRIEILYCGASEPDRIESALRKVLHNLPKRQKLIEPKTNVILYPEAYPPKRVIEELDISQGKISIGFRLGKFMDVKTGKSVNRLPMEKPTPDFPALFVFNSLYGGSPTSKLFLNVREKLALCYYASTMIDREKGIMVVTSGVDFLNFEAALSEIFTQLDNIKNGDINDVELLSAKRAVTTSIKSAMDRPGGLEDLYFNNVVSTYKYDPYDLCDLVESVTIERVVEASSDITPDTIHFLTSPEYNYK